MASPRDKFCSWLACQNKLLTKSRLYKWGLVDNDTCPLCKSAAETTDHILCTCPVAQQFLHLFLTDIHVFEPNLEFAGYVSKFNLATRKHLCLFQVKAALFCTCIAALWKLRNKVVFDTEVVHFPSYCTTVAQTFILRIQTVCRTENRTLKALITVLQAA